MCKKWLLVALILFISFQAHAQNQGPGGWKESKSTDRWGKVNRQYRDEDGNTVYEEREVGDFVFRGVNIAKKIGVNDYYPVYRVLTKTPQGLSLFREIAIEEVPVKKEDCKVPCNEDINVTNPDRRHRIHVGCYGVGARSGLSLLDFDPDQEVAYFEVGVDIDIYEKSLIFGFALRTGTWQRLGKGAASQVVSAQLSPSRQYLAIHRDTEGRSRDDFDADSFIEVINIRTRNISRFPKHGEYEAHQLNGTIDIEKFEWLSGDRIRFVQKMTSMVPLDMRPPQKVKKMGAKIKLSTPRKSGDKWENVVGPEVFGN